MRVNEGLGSVSQQDPLLTVRMAWETNLNFLRPNEGRCVWGHACGPLGRF